MGAIEKHILEIEKQMVGAFNQGKVEEILKFFDNEIIGFSSTRHERLMGLEALRQTFLYYLKDSESVEYSITSPLIKSMSDNCAVITFYWLVVMTSGRKRREIHGRGTHLFHKKENEWKIVHEHFSRTHHG